MSEAGQFGTARRRRAHQLTGLRHPIEPLILGACRSRACTVQQLAQALPAPPQLVRRHVRRLLALELLAAETPSRHAGRLATPYRTRVVVS